MGLSFAPPPLEPFGPLLLAGVQMSHRLGRARMQVYSDVAQQWRDFAAMAHRLPLLPPRLGYGIGLRIGDGEMDYFSGMVVSDKDRVPPEFAVLEIPALYCAVFAHHDHLAHLAGTMKLIFGTVLPMAAIEPAEDGPVMFIQRYGENFDPATGRGGIEVLVPIRI